ncbi:DUF805 domain-containing protein [Arthrobacter sp. JZ12]|uniref:DUF805 domain-containing protein n=1 Tax=Arthrobacter sp. JZ12 TaxID=2654190 RepID=UPI002B4926D5|nr:DUF805 domain-containing protein [Arthrobacter sp. JZ12]WRH24818.1 DUF805 domain-containing protein [Arthrobacter sp. JZ12]
MTHPQYQAPGVPGAASEPPLWAPYYGAPFKVAIQRFFKKYATFHGRASRSEYWWWALVSVLVSFVINIISGAGAAATTDLTTGTGGAGSMFGIILGFLWFAATIVPSLALVVRRLHDVNLSGWFLLVVLVPFLGAIALIVMMILPSNPAGQRYDRPEGQPVGY